MSIATGIRETPWRRTHVRDVGAFEAEFDLSRYPTDAVAALRAGQEGTAIKLAIQKGVRNENDLGNLIFFARHPERSGRPISRSE